MSSYTGKSGPANRARAIAAVAAIHVLLAAVIVSGLNVDKVREVVDQIDIVDVSELRPPTPRRPGPPPRKVSLATSRPAPKAQPSRVVAPPLAVPAPSPVAAAVVAGQSSAAIPGAAGAGSGTGGGGNGIGVAGPGFTPAQLRRNIPSSEYRQLAATGMPSGLVGVTVRVDLDGRPANCRIAHSSGQSAIDALVCRLTVRFVRFSPARDPQDRPVAQDVTYFPNWRRR